MTDHSSQSASQTTAQDKAASHSTKATDKQADTTAKVAHDPVIDQEESLVAKLEAKLKAAHESHLRTQADYQNLQRRSREERQQWVKLATREFVSALLEPLDHLGLAAQQLNDQGLNMTIAQLWERLREQGLEEIDPLNQPFDVQTMEAVDHEGDGEIVISVVKKGYSLNGEVIQHAKVIVGRPKEK